MKNLYKEELLKCRERIAKETMGSPEYEKDLKLYDHLYEQYMKTRWKLNIDWKSVAAIAGVVVGGAIAVRGQNLQAETAKLAYIKDDEMALCNNKVWNLQNKYQMKI